MRTGRTTKVFTFKGLERVETTEASAGDIALIAGLPRHLYRRDGNNQ